MSRRSRPYPRLSEMRTASRCQPNHACTHTVLSFKPNLCIRTCAVIPRILFPAAPVCRAQELANLVLM